MQIAVQTLIISVPSILNVMVICLLFFLLFGIFSVSYFKGQFFSCEQEYLSVKELTELIKDNHDCLNYGGLWISPDLNFDNISDAMLTLFVMATTEGWVSVM
jgi:hypothetical protein